MESDNIISSEEDGIENVSEVNTENPTPLTLQMMTNQPKPSNSKAQVSLGLVCPSDFFGANITTVAVYLRAPLAYFQRFVWDDRIQT